MNKIIRWYCWERKIQCSTIGQGARCIVGLKNDPNHGFNAARLHGSRMIGERAVVILLHSTQPPTPFLLQVGGFVYNSTWRCSSASLHALQGVLTMASAGTSASSVNSTTPMTNETRRPVQRKKKAARACIHCQKVRSLIVVSRHRILMNEHFVYIAGTPDMR